MNRQHPVSSLMQATKSGCLLHTRTPATNNTRLLLVTCGENVALRLRAVILVLDVWHNKILIIIDASPNAH